MKKLITVSSLLLLSSATQADMVVTEIMYNPAQSDSQWEWIEVFNTDANSVDLSGWFLDDASGSNLTSANISSGSIAGNSQAVLFNASLGNSAFEQAWGEGINLIAVNNWQSLNNGGDSIGLWASAADYNQGRDSASLAQVFVSYDSGSDWPTSDNSSSIYLLDLASQMDSAANWALSTAGEAGAYQSNTSTIDIGSPGIIAGTSEVPLPAALPLFISACTGLLALRRRRS